MVSGLVFKQLEVEELIVAAPARLTLGSLGESLDGQLQGSILGTVLSAKSWSVVQGVIP